MQNLKGSFLIAVFTFFVAILVTLSSQARISYLSLLPAVLVLLLIIFIGIISDMIGVAVTVATSKSFNARAAKKVFGAKEGLFLVKHADKVASFMCDIIGDICGTVSGASGAIIVLRIVNEWGFRDTIVTLVVIGLTAAITVGGKAFFKVYGMRNADNIVFLVGKILASFTLLSTKIRGGK